MFKKYTEFIDKKAQTWSEDKFIFVFIKLPFIVLSVYALLATGVALWSVNKNMQVAQDFLKLEASCQKMQETYRQRELYQAQYLREQQQRRYGQTETAVPLP